MGAQDKKRLKRIKDFVINRDGMLCCYCDMPLTLEQITLDHIVPESKRGTFNSTNLTVSCAKHNNNRGNQPFFDYCKQFNWSPDKISKYKKLYFDNLKIKVLNIAKEDILLNNAAARIIPQNLIAGACKVLKIKIIDFSAYENDYIFDIKFKELSDRKRIKPCFEQLIRIIEIDT